MGYTVSHFEIRARDTAVLEKFYTEVLGFQVTDRGQLPGRGELVFMSHSPEEHHQIVLIPSDAAAKSGSGIGHVAFRVDTLDEVRSVYQRVRQLAYAKPEPVSHGNTWSCYFRDPEGNRIEIFTQTPWHTTQPCRFDVDYEAGDAALKQATLGTAQELPGFTTTEEWQQNFRPRFADTPAE